MVEDLEFTKVVGTGNDFVLLDARGREQGRSWKRLAPLLCDRNRGIGADGLLVLEDSAQADARMRIINADGSEAEMCGNGARCVILYLAGRGANGRRYLLETQAGILWGEAEGARVRMLMPRPVDLKPRLSVRAAGKDYRGGFINTGVPHFVVPVRNLQAVDVAAEGRALRYHRDFAPKGTNVNFIAPHPAAGRIVVRTYERGVEGETLACGTGITAAAILFALKSDPELGASARWRRARLSVQPKSGDIVRVSFQARAGDAGVELNEVVVEGPAAIVFNGRIGVGSSGKARGNGAA